VFATRVAPQARAGPDPGRASKSRKNSCCLPQELIKKNTIPKRPQGHSELSAQYGNPTTKRFLTEGTAFQRFGVAHVRNFAMLGHVTTRSVPTLPYYYHSFAKYLRKQSSKLSSTTDNSSVSGDNRILIIARYKQNANFVTYRMSPPVINQSFCECNSSQSNDSDTRRAKVVPWVTPIK